MVAYGPSVAVMNRAANASNTKGYAGLWVGRVEDLADPKRQSRIRVRIFMIHGDARVTPTEALPWAEVNEMFGGGYDYGSAGAGYPVGSTVWVMFEMGDTDHPVVMGGRRSRNIQRDELNPREFRTLNGKSKSFGEKAWLPPSKTSDVITNQTNEIPKDVYADSSKSDNHPTRTVWAKSFKGHTILVEDKDGLEFLQIIDRAGQVIEMNCPVTSEDNANNLQQRGLANAIDDNQLSQDVLVDGQAFIRLKDVGGQEVILDGARNNQQIRLTSRNREGTAIQQVVLSSAKGSEKIEVTDKQGNTILLDPNSPTETIKIQDYSGNAITFDTESGQVKVASNNQANEETKGNKVFSIGGRREGTVGGDDITRVGGNKFLDVLNDLSTNIMGFTNAILSSAVNIQVVNAPASGVPATIAHKLQVVTGDIECETLLGEHRQISTTSRIGSALASEPLVLGNALTTALTDLVNNVFIANSANWGIGNLGSPVPLNPAVVTAINAWLAAHVASTAIISNTRFTQKL